MGFPLSLSLAVVCRHGSLARLMDFVRRVYRDRGNLSLRTAGGVLRFGRSEKLIRRREWGTTRRCRALWNCVIQSSSLIFVYSCSYLRF